MTAQLAPLAVQKFFDNNGQPLAFGLLSTYIAGTTTPLATYVDSTQTTPNLNPIQLNFRGECNLWLDPTKSYKFLLQDSQGNTIPGWPVDNIQSPPVSNWVNVLTYGADPTGLTDSSSAFQNALNSGATFVIAPPPNAGAKYIVHDVTIPSGVTLFAEGAYFNDAVGANWIFKVTGFNAKLIGGQISNANNCSQAAIIVDDGNWCEVRNLRVINATTVIKLQSSSNGANGFGCARTQLLDIIGVSFTGVGVDSGPNCHDTQGVNIYMDCGTISGTGGQIPRTGAIGFRFVGTGSTVAFGGNQFTSCNAINMQSGWVFTDSNLDTLVNCIGDSLSGYAYTLNGATNSTDILDCFAGTCGGSILGAGSSQNNRIVSLRTYGTGQIPSFGGSNWYSSAGLSAPFFELTQQNNAKFTIDLDSWEASNGPNAHTFTEAVQFNIGMTGGILMRFNSNTTVTANSTVYLGVNGQSASEDPQRALCHLPAVCSALRCVLDCNTAPGAGQSFTYTVRVNGGSTAVVGTTSGAGVFTATFTGGPVGINPNTDVDVQLVTSATAAAAVHRGYILLIPQPL